MGDPLHAWGWNIFGVWHRNTLRKKKLFISMGTCLKYQSCRKEKKKNYLFLLSEKKETEKRRRTLLASFFSPSRRLHANPSFGANSRRLCLAPVWSLAEKERESYVKRKAKTLLSTRPQRQRTKSLQPAFTLTFFILSFSLRRKRRVCELMNVLHNSRYAEWGLKILKLPKYYAPLIIILRTYCNKIAILQIDCHFMPNYND